MSFNEGMSVSFRTSEGVTIHDDESSDLIEVATKIKALRDSAKHASRDHSIARREIETDPHLNDHGRTERLAELDAAAASRRRASIRNENEIIDNKIAELERRLDGYVGYSSSDIVAYRDAQDRAEAVNDKDRAAKLMDRALRSNDRTLAHALYRAAIENNWAEAQHAFAKENPAVARLANDVQKLRNLRNQFGRGLAHM